MKLKTKASILRTTFTLSFALLMCLGCFISLDFPSGIPFTVQNFIAVLSALILGGLQGSGSVGLFLILGTLGLPVFAGCKGGWETFTGPTGGYLWGYFLAAAVSGLIVGTPHEFEKKFSAKMWIRIALASLLGFILIYVPGIFWYVHALSETGKQMSFSEAANSALLPFLPGDIIKFIVSVPLSAVFRPVVAKHLYPDDEEELKEFIDEMQKRKELRDKITNKITGKKKK